MKQMDLRSVFHIDPEIMGGAQMLVAA